MKTTLQFFLCYLLYLNLLNGQEWFKYADFPVNVIPKDVAVNNAGTVFLLSNDNSIFYKLADQDWHKMVSSVISPTCISVDETSNKLYVGTYNNGIMHTSNFGSSWGVSYIFTNPHTGMHESYNYISNIRNSNLLFAAYLGVNQISKFTNQGNNGQAVTVNPDPEYSVFDIFNTENNKVLIGSNDGVWISTDNGSSFSSSGLSGLNTFSFTEDQTQNVYVLTKDDSDNNQLWVSNSDQYASWTDLELPSSTTNFKFVYFDKSADMIWVVNENTIFKSPANSLNWTEENQNQSQPNVVEILDDNHGNLYSFSQENNCQLYNSSSWETHNEGILGDVQHILVDGNDKLYAYHNYFSNKLASLNTPSSDWENKMIGSNGISNLYEYDENTLVLNQWNNVYLSTDNGGSFLPIPLPDEFANQGGGGIKLFVKGNNSSLYITHTFIGDRLFRSDDLGENWSLIQTPDVVEQIIQDGNGNLLAVLFGANTTFVNEIHYSTDNGANWNMLDNDLINFSSSVVILFTHGGRNFVQIENKIYEIGLSSETLTEISIPYSGPNNFDLQFRINEAGEMFFIDADYNLFKSVDEGQNWVNLHKPTGVSNASTTSLEFGFDDVPFVIYKAYNSTSDLQGIYYYGEQILSVEEISTSSGLIVYPNPAKEELNIISAYKGNFHLFDSNGKLIFKGEIRGELETINVQSLPKGIYFLKLENGSSVKILKQ